MDIETSKNDNNLDESYEEDNFEMNSEIIEGLHIPRPEAGIHVQARQCIGRADGCSLPRVASSAGAHHSLDE